MNVIELTIGLIAVVAFIVAILAYQDAHNWEKQMRMELRHLELRVDSLMDVVRLLNKTLNT